MRTALLDLDGTLVDSAALITEHLSAALASVGRPVPAADLRSFVGPPFETALPALGLTGEQTAAVVTAYRASYDKVAATQTPLYPRVPELLQGLADAGIQLAVATSKPERLARAIAAGVGIAGRFALVGGADHVGGRVGKAAVVGSVLERLAVDPTREPVVMVGDRHHDVDGAAEHGIPTVAVTWGYAEPGELHGAAKVVGDVDELLDVLTSGAVWSVPPPA
ncbi:HAD hydrolase-like protein [Pseudonocardia sp. TRM90224]|uniref:HAD hydrolase-like protein n=1 Tax=Pseudonocardia sp. TRM90224 TaxID=2812678 RepID=UPI001E4B94A2|nr:HAD hydrolase-like protein [Pseudonocardia sp. TRM90224]